MANKIPYRRQVGSLEKVRIWYVNNSFKTVLPHTYVHIRRTYTLGHIHTHTFDHGNLPNVYEKVFTLKSNDAKT